MKLLGFLLVGAAAGWLAGQITKGRGFGLLGNMLVGVLGAMLGGFLFGVVGLAATGVVGGLIMSVVGAVVLLAVMGWLGRR